MKQIFILLTLILSLFFLAPKSYAAYDAQILCNNSDCNASNFNNLFQSTDIWFPGKEVTKSFQVLNESDFIRKIIISPKNFSSTGDLDSVMVIHLSKESDGSVLYHDSLKNFYNNTSELSVTVAKQSNIAFLMSAQMDVQAGNEYQGKNTSFDLSLKITDEIEDTDNNGGNTGSGSTNPTGTITPTPSNNSSQNSGESSNSSQNNSSSNSSSSSSNTLGASVSQGISRVIDPIINSFRQSNNQLGDQEILGASESGNIKNEMRNGKPPTKTDSIAECTQNYNWVIILGLQILLILALYKYVKNKKVLIYSIIISAVAFISIFLIICTKWYALLALLPLVIHLKSLKK